MSPVGQALSGWLQTCPGPVRGENESEAYAKAQALAGVRFKLLRNLSPAEFREALMRAGYAPQERRAHGSDDGAVYNILTLPEGL